MTPLPRPFRRPKWAFASLAQNLRRDEGGALALTFALLLIPLLLAAGVGLDYSRAVLARQELRAAVDAASLAGTLQVSKGDLAVERAALNSVRSNLASSGLQQVEIDVKLSTEDGAQGVTVAATGTVKTYLLGVMGKPTLEVGATSRAVTQGSSPIEVALVLDTTGSMVGEMAGLKTAAKNFANQAFSISSKLKMSVVPYVAAVNVGSNMNPAMLDVNADSTYHGNLYRGAWTARSTACAAPGGGSGGGGGSDPGSSGGKDKTGFNDVEPTPFGDAARRLALDLFGISKAAAAPSPPGVTANTVDPIIFSGGVPQGFDVVAGCYLRQPMRVSHFDLIARIRNASWKGCVEARAAPYDVTDDAPNASIPDTKFTPYFAPDEPAFVLAGYKFNNDYQSDSHKGWEARRGAPPNFDDDQSMWNRWRDILKYDSANSNAIDEVAPATLGPNYACPDPLLTLTSNQTAVLNKIDSLSHWEGGGTISSEGLMWGWRTLSPNAPFAMGASYSATDTKKYIVLMSDGLNALVSNRPANATDLISDYSAYGYLAALHADRFGTTTFAGAEKFLNDRMLAACTNAKAKGIGIFTILFRETDPATVQLLRNCASSPQQALLASNASALGDAFQTVAGQLGTGKLRLAK